MRRSLFTPTFLIGMAMALIAAVACREALAQAKYIPLQGQLTEQDISGGGANVVAEDGVYTLTVRIYQSPTGGGSEVWEDTFQDLPVVNGVFNLLLGSQTSLENEDLQNLPVGYTGDLLDLLSERKVLYVGLTITQKGGVDVPNPVEMLPRLSLLPVAVALKSDEANHAESAELAQRAIVADAISNNPVSVQPDGTVSIANQFFVKPTEGIFRSFPVRAFPPDQPFGFFAQGNRFERYVPEGGSDPWFEFGYDTVTGGQKIRTFLVYAKAQAVADNTSSAYLWVISIHVDHNSLGIKTQEIFSYKSVPSATDWTITRIQSEPPSPPAGRLRFQPNNIATGRDMVFTIWEF